MLSRRPAKSPGDMGTEAVAREEGADLLNTVRANLAAMLRSSDNPKLLQEKVLEMLKSKDPAEFKAVVATLRLGWEASLSSQQTAVTNMGVLAALVLSILLGFLSEGFTPAHEAEDMWSDARENMSKALTVMIFLSTFFALLCVVVTVIWLTHGPGLIQDADDYLWFVTMDNSSIVDFLLVVCLILCSASVIVSAAVVNEDPVASICFFSGVGFGALVLAWYVRSLVGIHRHTLRQRASMGEKYLAVVLDEYKKVEGAAVGVPCPQETPSGH